MNWTVAININSPGDIRESAILCIGGGRMQMIDTRGELLAHLLSEVKSSVALRLFSSSTMN